MTEETKKTLTVKEFKCWLEGVEEMQEDGWCPSHHQWIKIRNKINSLKEQADIVKDNYTTPAVPSHPVHRYPPNMHPGVAPGTPTWNNSPSALSDANPTALPRANNSQLGDEIFFPSADDTTIAKTPGTVTDVQADFS